MDRPDEAHGAHRRAELIRRVGRYRVNTDIERGVLRRLWPGVVVETGRLFDLHTRASAALLSHGPHSVICGPSAARLHGCTAAAAAETHVMVPYGHPSRSRDGLVVHNGLAGEDVTRVDGLRTLSLERVVTDLLCTGRPRDALAVTDQALARHRGDQRLYFRSRVAQRLANRSDPRGTRRGARILGLATGRAESPPESWLMLDVVELGLPPPCANWPVCSPDGRELYRIDLAWPDQRVALEHNGYAVHRDRTAEDRARNDDLRQRGWIVVVATADDLRDNRRLERELREAFRKRGYTWGPDLSRLTTSATRPDRIRDSP